MSRWRTVAATGVASVLLHPMRSVATVLCLVAMVAPYLAGAGVGRGLARQAETSIASGAELFVGGRRFGRAAPLPASVAEKLSALPGVTAVAPRIVGEARLGRDRVPVVVIGVDPARRPPDLQLEEGDWFGPTGLELVVGAQLARRLGMQVGDRIPPFYRNPKGEKVARIVGMFGTEHGVWSAQVALCSIEAAQSVFHQPGFVTAFAVECAAGYREAVHRTIERWGSLHDGPTGLRPRVVSRDEIRAMVPRGLGHLQGLFQTHFLLVFALGIPLLAVASGIGLTERKREASLLKATGWMTDELMVRGLVESAVLALLGASLGLLVAWIWIGPLQASGIAGVFLLGATDAGGVRVPFELWPVPVVLSYCIAFTLIAVGTVVSIARATAAHPAEALR